MSLLLRWSASEREPALLPLAAAVAVCDIVGPQALVKWPNDVVLRRGATDAPTRATGGGSVTSGNYADLAKLAGILIEGRPQERWLVLGIGVNVAVDLAGLPQEVRGTAATLGKPSDEIEPTLAALLQALEERLAAPVAQTLAAWRSRDALIGSQVAWQHGVGHAEGVSDRGGLLLRTQDGSTVELDSGEVTPANPARVSERRG
jgi:BirA family biotin operon repressor/biotin-[acetyl-CoA-carboxylase] ligase